MYRSAGKYISFSDQVSSLERGFLPQFGTTSTRGQIYIMGACASKRLKPSKLDEAEEKYDVLASLFATRAQDLVNIVSEYEACKKAEELAFEEAVDLRQQLNDLEARYAFAEEEHERETGEWRTVVERKDEEVVAYQRVVTMRTEERNSAREEADMLRKEMMKLQKGWSWTSENTEIL